MDELLKTIPESIENTLNYNMPDIVETLVDKVYDKINSPEEKLTGNHFKERHCYCRVCCPHIPSDRNICLYVFKF